MHALFQLQYKHYRALYIGCMVLFVFFIVREWATHGEYNSFNSFFILLIYSMMSSNYIFLQEPKNTAMVLGMPLSRRTIISSVYQFNIVSFLTISAVTLAVQLWVGFANDDILGALQVFIYAFSVSFTLLAFQLYLFFTGNLKSLGLSESLISLIFSFLIIFLPMFLLSLLFEAAILIGLVCSIIILFITYRSAAKHFEQKEVRL